MGIVPLEQILLRQSPVKLRTVQVMYMNIASIQSKHSATTNISFISLLLQNGILGHMKPALLVVILVFKTRRESA